MNDKNLNGMLLIKVVGLFVCLCSVSAYINCHASETPALFDENSTSTLVEVTGIRDPDWKPYEAMLKGVKRFEEMHDLAPAAELRFILLPRRPEVNMTALQLRLEGQDSSLPIPLEEGNIFVLPVEQAMLQAKAELTLNRKAGSVRWLPYVRSATTSGNIRRLGDLRLACEVHWAIDRERLPFAVRSTIGALGGPCNFVSKKGTYSFIESKRIISAVISLNGKSEAVPVDGDTFTPPLRDKRWSNDSVIELKFESD